MSSMSLADVLVVLLLAHLILLVSEDSDGEELLALRCHLEVEGRS